MANPPLPSRRRRALGQVEEGEKKRLRSFFFFKRFPRFSPLFLPQTLTCFHSLLLSSHSKTSSGS